MSEGGIGELLSSDQLVCAASLPTKPAAVTLEGRYVRLLPLDLDRDLDALHSISNGEQVSFGTRTCEAYNADELIWRYMSMGPFDHASDLSEFLCAQIEAKNGLPFTVFDKLHGRPVGVCNFMNNLPAHLKIELGNIWYGPIAQRTNANLEATRLMLTHLFSLGYRRVEWKCDARNERSRRAALRMGFQFEGVQESHFIVKNRNRDTAWYRILDREWPLVRERLRSLLA
ncbi:MAG: GNAT family N-acetyltransferase [Candidatus Obscuribacterales bacterium]|nr:GNAT family N-acetyltransferase [Candidatus Obscuribacterales bacterium]